MFTLLTADDEPDKLEALRELYHWQDYDIQIVGEAQDGRETYRLLTELHPDICIIDIRMPGLNGLDVIQHAEENGEKTKFIVFSGYGEFDYAQKALHLQIVDYLLKPCRYEDVMQAVKKAVDMVKEERNRQKLLDEYFQLSINDAQKRKEQFLSHLASGTVTAPDKIQNGVTAFHLDALLSCYAVCTVFPVDGQTENNPIIAQNLLDIIGTVLDDMGPGETFLLKDQAVIIVSLSDISVRFNRFQDALFKIMEAVGARYGLHSVIGISDLKTSPLLLQEAYTEALKAANLSAFNGVHGIRYYAELNDTPKAYDSSRNEKHVIAAVIGESGDVSAAVDAFFSDCATASPESRRIIQQMASALVCNIFRVCLEYNMIFNLFSKRMSDTIEEISKSKTLQEIQTAVLQFASEVSQSFTGNKQTSALISMALQYIHENFCRKINLEMTADILHISPAYLSTLFKQQTGTNFIDYLNRYRIQKAKGYLKDVDKKVYEVANQIGIQDEKYFHSLFKRYTGLTATQYRDSMLFHPQQEPPSDVS